MVCHRRRSIVRSSAGPRSSEAAQADLLFQALATFGGFDAAEILVRFDLFPQRVLRGGVTVTRGARRLGRVGCDLVGDRFDGWICHAVNDWRQASPVQRAKPGFRSESLNSVTPV